MGFDRVRVTWKDFSSREVYRNFVQLGKIKRGYMLVPNGKPDDEPPPKQLFHASQLRIAIQLEVGYQVFRKQWPRWSDDQVRRTIVSFHKRRLLMGLIYAWLGFRAGTHRLHEIAEAPGEISPGRDAGPSSKLPHGDDGHENS